jgi:hypothetical protein
MDNITVRFLRTWIDYLLAANMREEAALVADAELEVLSDNWGNEYGIHVHLPPACHQYVFANRTIENNLTSSLTHVVEGHLHDQDGDARGANTIEFGVRLLDVEDNWRSVVRELIANAKDPNQGVIAQKVFARVGKSMYTYNEMKFASQSEIRIAQELERRHVLFFPLPLAVRAETGELYKDHREPDFVICHNGLWGILEVAHHPDRYEQDKEKDLWFKQSGILCVEHHTAERCYTDSRSVVDEFLGILSQHKR